MTSVLYSPVSGELRGVIPLMLQLQTVVNHLSFICLGSEVSSHDFVGHFVTLACLELSPYVGKARLQLKRYRNLLKHTELIGLESEFKFRFQTHVLYTIPPKP